MSYSMSKPNYAQISSLSDIVNPGVYITGSGLFMEPATLLDKTSQAEYI